jgi:hypothetical protein
MEVAYAENPQSRLFAGPEIAKQPNGEIAAAFRERLKKPAGFAHVAEPLPMRNSTNAVVYYLFCASQKSVAEKIIDEIFSKYR